MGLTTVSIPMALRRVRAYQLYVQGKTVEEIALLERLPLADVLAWKAGSDGENSWDEDLRRMEADLKDTIDGEMKSWAKLAVETVGMTGMNTLVLCAKQIQKRVVKGDSLTNNELVELTKVSLLMMKTLKELNSDGGEGKVKGKDQTKTKAKNLGKGNAGPALPTVPPVQGEGSDEEGEGEEVEESGRVGPAYEVEDDSTQGDEG